MKIFWEKGSKTVGEDHREKREASLLPSAPLRRHQGSISLFLSLSLSLSLLSLSFLSFFPSLSLSFYFFLSISCFYLVCVSECVSIFFAALACAARRFTIWDPNGLKMVV